MFNTIKKMMVFAAVLSFGFGASYAEDAVFGGQQKARILEMNAKSLDAKTVSQNSEIEAVNVRPVSETLSNEKFKSAVNNLESAQVDVREQLATYKTLVDQKQIEVNNKKTELSKLKREYFALQRKMRNIEKMKKMLNNNII